MYNDDKAGYGQAYLEINKSLLYDWVNDFLHSPARLDVTFACCLERIEKVNVHSLRKQISSSVVQEKKQ